jgi:hypothetical protein
MNPPGSPPCTAHFLEAFDLASRLAVLGLVELLPEVPPQVATAVEKFLSEEEKDFLRAARKTYELLATAPATGTTRRKRSAATGQGEIESARLVLLERLQSVVGTLLLQSHTADRPNDTRATAPRRARAKR